MTHRPVWRGDVGSEEWLPGSTAHCDWSWLQFSLHLPSLWLFSHLWPNLHSYQHSTWRKQECQGLVNLRNRVCCKAEKPFCPHWPWENPCVNSFWAFLLVDLMQPRSSAAVNPGHGQTSVRTKTEVGRQAGKSTPNRKKKNWSLGILSGSWASKEGLVCCSTFADLFGKTKCLKFFHCLNIRCNEPAVLGHSFGFTLFNLPHVHKQLENRD